MQKVSKFPHLEEVTPKAEFSSISETGSQDKPRFSSLKLSKQHRSWSYLVGLFMLFKAYKAKAFGFSSGICHHFNTQRFTIFAKELLQSFIIHVIPKVFNIDIGEFLCLGSQLGLPLFTRLESPNKSALEWRGSRPRLGPGEPVPCVSLLIPRCIPGACERCCCRL